MFRAAGGFFDDAISEEAVQECVEGSRADFDLLYKGVAVPFAFGEGEEDLELGGGEGEIVFRLRHNSVDGKYIDD